MEELAEDVAGESHGCAGAAGRSRRCFCFDHLASGSWSVSYTMLKQKKRQETVNMKLLWYS